MVTIEYEQSLVETAVFLAVRSEQRLECALHQAVDRLYEIPDEELRQRAFVPVFREFFTRLRLDRLIAGLLAERPLVGALVDRCVVRDAPRKKSQSAELLVRNNKGCGEAVRRTLVIQVCPQSFIDTGRFVSLMRRELLHVADMLDERFGYVRETFYGEPSRQNLQRDRYCVLWDMYVEGRLERERFVVYGKKERLEQAFHRVFAHSTPELDGRVFARVFDAPSLTHRQFMDWTREPALLFDSSLDGSRLVANMTDSRSTPERTGAVSP